MRKIFIIFFYTLLTSAAGAQVSFNTMVPREPVVPGESFQVQYIIRDAEKIGNFKAPAFDHFRFVSGPNIYNGVVSSPDDIHPIRNFVYTLEAVRPGRFTIRGATVLLNGKPIKSNDVILEVITKDKASKYFDRNMVMANPDYVLRPGEDPYEKIRQNLFLKVDVDRTTCYTGEPVLAVFKLYSRLESNSDIVKNPGFYGFTVHDMVSLSDKQVNSEMLNGKWFDVHTIRKIQLFPLQAGLFTIDPMEVKNKIEFSRSMVSKKTEQEIIEGLSGNNKDEKADDNTDVFETSMHTEPLVIRVKPLPDKNIPALFNGAVGTFSVSASILQNRIAKNEEGVFEIRISGNGNFTQLSKPVIDWPAGIEGFEPSIRDSLDKTHFPLSGSRTFRYTFVCNHPGRYQLPPVNFSFFDPHSNGYKTVTTASSSVEIGNEEKKEPIHAERKESITAKNSRASRVAGGIIILLVIIVLTYWIMHKEKPAPSVQKEKIVLPSVGEGLAPMRDLIDLSDKEFFTGLQQFIWKHLGNRFDMEGSLVNKENLFSGLKQKSVDDRIIADLQKILTDCEMGMFTGASLDVNKEKMLADVKVVLEAIDRLLL